jgi:hypothetical protein
MYWKIAQILFATFFPFVPVNPRVSSPTETRKFWVFECTDFTSVWALGHAALEKYVLCPGVTVDKTD